MKKQSRRIFEWTAYHEAGHVVAAWYAGARFDRVVVRTPEEAQRPYINSQGNKVDCVGLVDGLPRSIPLSKLGLELPPFYLSEDQSIRQHLPSIRRNTEVNAFLTLAGLAAEVRRRRYTRNGLFGMALGGNIHFDDWYDACALLEDIMPASEAKRWSIELLGHAFVFFGQRLIWGAVQALAIALQERKRLTFQQSLAIIQRETGEGKRPSSTLRTELGVPLTQTCLLKYRPVTSRPSGRRMPIVLSE